MQAADRLMIFSSEFAFTLILGTRVETTAIIVSTGRLTLAAGINVDVAVITAAILRESSTMLTDTVSVLIDVIIVEAMRFTLLATIIVLITDIKGAIVLIVFAKETSVLVEVIVVLTPLRTLITGTGRSEILVITADIFLTIITVGVIILIEAITVDTGRFTLAIGIIVDIDATIVSTGRFALMLEATTLTDGITAVAFLVIFTNPVRALIAATVVSITTSAPEEAPVSNLNMTR